MLRKIGLAVAATDGLSKVALVCLILGWFFTDTLVATWGSLQHGVKFFDMSAVIADPSMMFFRISFSFGVLMFSLLCALCIAAPLLPHLVRRPALAVGNFAPLLLFLACAALLWHRTSGDFVPTPHDPQGIAGKVVGFANQLLNRSSAVVAHHVSVGLGGYLGLLASVALAVQGMRNMKAKPTLPPSGTPTA